MTIGPIPWTATQRWARANRVLNRERFAYLIREADRAFLDEAHKSEKEPAKKKPEAPRG